MSFRSEQRARGRRGGRGGAKARGTVVRRVSAWACKDVTWRLLTEFCAAGLFCTAVPRIQRICIWIASEEVGLVRSACRGSHIFSFSRSVAGHRSVFSRSLIVMGNLHSLFALSICSMSISKSSRACIRSSSSRFSSTATANASFMSSASDFPRMASITPGSRSVRGCGGGAFGSEFAMPQRSSCSMASVVCG